ncbi:MAG: DUF4260 domain-containing protein [Ignavibacteria bacterium]|nr:DUF4260 domain-containing protein [Ignavibacteria bacterium]
MKLLLQLEELALFALGVVFFSTLGYSWWTFLGLILAPDIGMLGYLVNSKVGAVSYNLLHHRGIAIVVGLLGFSLSIPILTLTGTILFTHAAMDRMLGYGLKYSDNFAHTHLGMIGQKNPEHG